MAQVPFVLSSLQHVWNCCPLEVKRGQPWDVLWQWTWCRAPQRSLMGQHAWPHSLPPSALVTGFGWRPLPPTRSWCEKMRGRPSAGQRQGVAWAKRKASRLGGLGYLAYSDHTLIERVGRFEIFLLGPSQMVPKSWEWCKPCPADKCFVRACCLHASTDTEFLAQKNCYRCIFWTLARLTSLNYWVFSTLPRIQRHYHANMLSTAKRKLLSRGTSVNHMELLVGVGMWKHKSPRAILTQTSSFHFWLNLELDSAIPPKVKASSFLTLCTFLSVIISRLVWVQPSEIGHFTLSVC